MVYIIVLIFKAQISLMQFLEEFKVNEIFIVQFIKILLLCIKALTVHYNKTTSFKNIHLIMIDFKNLFAQAGKRKVVILINLAFI
jgi:hypothetical protein